MLFAGLGGSASRERYSWPLLPFALVAYASDGATRSVEFYELASQDRNSMSVGDTPPHTKSLKR